jgi:phenylalanyl-tRNA synthetase beta chain
MIKVPLSWLKDYVDITLSPEELAKGLTLRGLEVAAIIRTGAGWDKVIVGQVERLGKHPNADRLIVLQVTDGRQFYQVVTGAMNLKEGDRIPLALAGARLIDGHKMMDELHQGKRTAPLLSSGDLPYFTVKPGKMRGVESNAVAVAALELGINEDFVGIVVLDPAAPLGAPLADVLGEVILDIELSPNLGRALSMIGIAREVAAMTGQKVRLPQIHIREAGPPVTEKASVRIDAPDLCSRFSLMVIEGVQIAPSPDWMQRRLIAAGIRPISNIVDVTNYVMLEVGQPLHSYDYDMLHGHQFIVRRAKPGEKIETIDHKDHDLSEEVLLVADADRGVGMAGVMGGADTEISDTTINVALEGANWNPANIRKTARNMFSTVSEAAKRFERSVDIESTVLGVRRGIQLMQELAGGTVAKGMLDVYPNPRSPHVIELPLSEIPRILGITIPKDEVVKMLEALEFEIAHLKPGGSYQFEEDSNQYTIIVSDVPANSDVLMVRVPTYRNDVTIKADLIEEIARMYGYDKIPETRLQGELPPHVSDLEWQFEDRLRDILTGAGLSEIITYPPVSLRVLQLLNASASSSADGSVHWWADPDKLLKLANPLSAEHEYMRPTLMASTLETVAENRRFNERVALFELGRVYLLQPDQSLPDERRTLTMAMTGPRDLLSRYHPKVTNAADEFDFYDIKGVVENLLERLNCSAASLEWEPLGQSETPAMHPGRTACLYVRLEDGSRLRLGIVGEVHPKVVEAFDLNPLERVALAELDMAALMKVVRKEIYQVVPRLPVVTQDLAIVVADETPAGQVQRLIRETGGALLREVTLFDLYRGKPIPEGKKSLAFRLAFQPVDRTLTEDEVTKIRQRIEARLVKELKAETRG